MNATPRPSPRRRGAGLAFFSAVVAALAIAATVHAAGAFAKGADVGWLPRMEAASIAFRDYDGTAKDCLEILRGNGIDTVRLRVWVDPSDDPVNGHCGRDEVVALAVRARDLGLRVMINFHYSDSWADPGKQTKPRAWQHLDFAGLLDAVEAHTRDVLGALRSAGVTPEWVQIGNEIRGGMLWPDGHTDDFARLARLLNRAHDTVKSIDAAAKVVVHLDHGHDNALYRWFFGALQKHGTRYDVIGMSYYPHWIGSHYTATIDDLARNLNDMALTHGKEVMVVEIGGHHEQAENTYRMIAAVIERVRAVPDSKGLGVIYWEPQGNPSFSRGYALGCWNRDGTPTVALQAFRESPDHPLAAPEASPSSSYSK